MLKIRKLTSIMVITGAMLISGGIFGCSTTQNPAVKRLVNLKKPGCCRKC